MLAAGVQQKLAEKSCRLGGDVETQIRMVSMGDSVMWGQGLQANEKFDSLVAATLGAALDRVAHSGAVIDSHGSRASPRSDEVPTARLSVREQCASYRNAPDTVKLVLVNGGINDVNIVNILNPVAGPLEGRVRSACADSMLTLLREIVARFSNPTCKILVLGYYAILSPNSDAAGVEGWLSLNGVTRPGFANANARYDYVNSVVSRCKEFLTLSTQYLGEAVRAVGDSRVRFVASGFNDDNALFAEHSLLWEFKLDGTFDPIDPVALIRHTECQAAYPDTGEFLIREVCYRASVGHPNLRGAQRYRDQIVAML
jgi:lysophospholipase L1-like esterase